MTKRTEDRFITQELAAEFLARNHPRNRAVTRPRVEEFKVLLREGRFIYTHQGIAFDTDGLLVDGQKRLAAISETGIGAHMQITWDLPKAAFAALDSGEKRNDAQKLFMGGLDIDKDDVAVIRTIGGSIKGAAKLSLPVISEMFFKLKDALEFCRLNYPKKKNPTSIRAVIVRAFYTANRNRLEEFCRVLANAEVTCNGDGAAVKLGMTYSRADWGSVVAKRDLYCLTERALHHFLNYQNVGTLKPVSEELFPLPWEVESPAPFSGNGPPA